MRSLDNTPASLRPATQTTGTEEDTVSIEAQLIDETSNAARPWLERPLNRVIAIKPDEVQGAMLSFAYFFAVLCAYYIIRPVRDEMGVTVGQAGLEKLFTIVFVVMLAAVPLFGWVVSRFEKRRIVPYVYAFFIANLLGFWALLGTGTITAWVAGAFFVWASVFNLFVVSMFWILMSDLWRTDQAKRLFGFIAAGGSAGAFMGPLITQTLVKVVGPTNLLLISAALLLASIAVAMRLRQLFEGQCADRQRSSDVLTGKGILAGAEAVWRSPFLFRIALWILLANIVSTFFYFEQTRIVGETITDRASRVQLFARLDLAVSVLTILSQVFLAARVIGKFGVATTAAALPAVAVVGLLALSIAPVLAVIVTVMALERAIAFALANPAVKTLYTSLDPEEKYKAQNFIDTVVYRGGDAMSGWLFNGLSKGLGLGMATIALVTVPVALLWLATSFALGRASGGEAEEVDDVEAA